MEVQTKQKRHGKEPLYGETMKNYLVVLDRETVLVAKQIGEGNLSKGIRELVKIGYEQSKKGLSE